MKQVDGSSDAYVVAETQEFALKRYVEKYGYEPDYSMNMTCGGSDFLESLEDEVREVQWLELR